MRCYRPSAAVAVLSKDPNSSWDLLVQIKQEKAAEPIGLGLSSLDQVQVHLCFKPERASLESYPTVGLFNWGHSSQGYYMWQRKRFWGSPF